MAKGRLINVSELAVDEWIVFTEGNKTIRGRVVWVEKSVDGDDGSSIIDVREADGELHTIVRKMVKRIPSPSVRERLAIRYSNRDKKKEKKKAKPFQLSVKERREQERLMNTPPEMLKPITSTTNRDSTGGIQHGGNHYKQFPIQPVDYAEENKLTMTEGSVVKYVSRHRFSGKGMGDLRKAFHFLQMLARRYYGVEVSIIYSDQPKET